MEKMLKILRLFRRSEGTKRLISKEKKQSLFGGKIKK
jgi:hypothetical protein